MNDQDEIFEAATETPVSLGCPSLVPPQVITHDEPARDENANADPTVPLRTRRDYFDDVDAYVLCSVYPSGKHVLLFWMQTGETCSQKPFHVQISYWVPDDETGTATIRINREFFATVQSADPKKVLAMAMQLVIKYRDDILNLRAKRSAARLRKRNQEKGGEE